MIAVIAGTGSLPLEACKALQRQQRPFFVVALFGEQNGAALAEVSPLVVHQQATKAGDILAALKRHHATHVLFIGKVDKQLLLKKVKLDWLAIKILGSLVFKSDQAILERILAEVAAQGLEVLRQHEVLPGLLVKPGTLVGTLDETRRRSVELGMRTAHLIAQSDIGQAVVVKDQMVLAVEAIEGTDACIRRGIELGHDSLIVCKSAFAAHNTKYDLPTIGPATIQPLLPGQVSVIAWQASHTLIIERERCIELARERGVTLVSVPG